MNVDAGEETQDACALVRARATLFSTRKIAYQPAHNISVPSQTPQRSEPALHPPHGRHSSGPLGEHRYQQQLPPPMPPSWPPRHPHLGLAPTTGTQRHHRPAAMQGTQCTRSRRGSSGPVAMARAAVVHPRHVTSRGTRGCRHPPTPPPPTHRRSSGNSVLLPSCAWTGAPQTAPRACAWHGGGCRGASCRT